MIMTKMAKIPLNPKNPERICWGCDKYCPADSLACGNGTIRTQHPAELFGADWLEWANDSRPAPTADDPLQPVAQD
jgi:Protein of unknown function (DUF3079)